MILQDIANVIINSDLYVNEDVNLVCIYIYIYVAYIKKEYVDTDLHEK